MLHSLFGSTAARQNGRPARQLPWLGRRRHPAWCQGDV